MQQRSYRLAPTRELMLQVDHKLGLISLNLNQYTQAVTKQTKLNNEAPLAQLHNHSADAASVLVWAIYSSKFKAVHLSHQDQISQF